MTYPAKPRLIIIRNSWPYVPGAIGYWWVFPLGAALARMPPINPRGGFKTAAHALDALRQLSPGGKG